MMLRSSVLVLNVNSIPNNKPAEQVALQENKNDIRNFHIAIHHNASSICFKFDSKYFDACMVHIF